MDVLGWPGTAAYLEMAIKAGLGRWSLVLASYAQWRVALMAVKVAISILC